MGHGYLIPPDEQQIQRIMEVKVDVHNAGAQRPWDIPDVQVVLWFILLCCLTEGIVVGVRWWVRGVVQSVEVFADIWRWRGPDVLFVQQRRVDEKEPDRLRPVEEEDEDDESNIPVLWRHWDGVYSALPRPTGCRAHRTPSALRSWR
jgi:hypothetical protein